MAPASSADPVSIYDNLTDGPFKSTNDVYLAQSFTTDANGGELSVVKIMYRGSNESNTYGANSSFTASIYTSNNGQPGSLVSALETKSTNAWDNETYSLNIPTGISLSPSTEYFLVINGVSTGTLCWKYTTTPPTSFEGSSVSAWTSDNGSTWSVLSNMYFSMQLQTIQTAVAPVLGELSEISLQLDSDPITITPPTSNAAGSWSYQSSDSNIFSVNGSQLIPNAVGVATLTANFTPTDSTAYLSGSVNAQVTVTAVQPTPTPTSTKKPKPTETGGSTSSPTPTKTTTNSPTPSASSTTPLVPSPTKTPANETESADANEVSLPRLSDQFFNEPPAVILANLDVHAGLAVTSGSVVIKADGLMPNSVVTATAYSNPIEFYTDRADSNGQLNAVVSLPAGLEPNAVHSVVITGTDSEGQALTVVGAISLDAESLIIGAAEMAEVAAFTNATEVSLIRAAKYNLALFDPSVNVITTTGVVIAATSLLALGGSGGLTQTPNQSGERRNTQGKLANVVTKKLKAAGANDAGFGDLKFKTRPLGSDKLDAVIARLVSVVGTRSALFPRILVDGSWLRVLAGSGSILIWLLAIGLVTADAIANPSNIVMPSLTILFLIIILSFVDSLAGALAFAAATLIAIVQGEIQIASDIRMLLGLGVLMTSLPLLVHVIRPLRRKVEDKESLVERVFDYLMPPVFVAFAAGGMLKALNGLSGLELVTIEQIEFIRWAGFFGVLIRMAGEDLALRLFPQRCLVVHPQKLPSQSRNSAVVSIIMRTSIFLFIAEPFFGIGVVSIAAAALLAIPIVLKLWEDDLPNLIRIHKWLPRGLFRFVLLLVSGILLSRLLLGEDPTDELLKTNFAWLLIPAFVAAALELFGRFGGDWENTKIKWFTGAPIWFFAVGLTMGLIHI